MERIHFLADDRVGSHGVSLYEDFDEDVLRTAPGLYPDPLFPIREQAVPVLSGQWRSVWITIQVDRSIQEGNQMIKIVFEGDSRERLAADAFELTVIPAEQPKQELIHTEWFHADCLATHYGVDVFSEAHWDYIDRYMKTASEHGINMILTPIFTPPLDTAVGGERPTLQLVDVVKPGGNYLFGFDKLTLTNRKSVLSLLEEGFDIRGKSDGFSNAGSG